MACNFAKRLQTLEEADTYTYKCKIWSKNTNGFILNPHAIPWD